PVDGEPFSARLAGVKADGELIFSDGTMQRSIPANALVRWGAPVEPARGPVAVLTDGGLLSAEVARIDAGQVAFESDSLGEVRLPLESLAGIILAWPSDPAGQDRIIGRVLAAEGPSDRVLLANGDRLTGVVADVNGRDVRLDTDGKISRLPRDCVAAVVFNPALRAQPGGPAPRTWIGLDEGTQLPVDRLASTDGLIRFVPRGAGVNAKPWSTDARRLVFVQPLGGRAEYLSDRAPDGYRHVPYLDLQWPYHNDRNVLGGRLRAGGRMYLKGLGVHSMARLTYRLDEPFDRFEAELALDDAAGAGGNVRYHVYVDRRRTFSSEPVRGGDPPAAVRVDLAGAKRLDLVVDYGQRADQLDYANWLDARLIRPETPRNQIPPPTRRQTQSEPRP
ncbi:MAG: NPCBM/NEW2 domain-containing protein, partial [Pirellulales bacterium]|nr:NPCBM/NEW2 domain-containing protein [Pirellulales bacterium]